MTERAEQTERTAARAAFLDTAGWGGAASAPLAADASARRYERLTLDGRTAVLMDAPGPEDVRPFVSMAAFLAGLGFSAPEILAENAEAGFLLLEDLGDATFTHCLRAGEPAEETLYLAAAETLAALQAQSSVAPVPEGLTAYEPEMLTAEAALLPDWFAPAVRGEPLSAAAREAYIKAWSMPFEMMKYLEKVVVLRDFHVDNLVWLPAREGVRRTGLLDFQDAVAGHPAYDLMSLVEDARRDVPENTAQICREVFMERRPHLKGPQFDSAFAVLAAGRHAKVIGIFTRLNTRDGKPAYLDHIPRCWRMLERHLDHPALKDVKAWFDAYMPPGLRVRPA
ncbi:MAG: aminoglycoside phosphotransferase family protein [Rhodospirillales bacterium]